MNNVSVSERPADYVWDEFPRSHYDHAAPWIEITDQMWNYCLEVLPPRIWVENAFMIGEAASHVWDEVLNDNITVYDAIVNIGKLYEDGARFFLAPRRIDRFDAPTFTREIKEQFGI